MYTIRPFSDDHNSPSIAMAKQQYYYHISNTYTDQYSLKQLYAGFFPKFASSGIGTVVLTLTVKLQHTGHEIRIGTRETVCG
jgi:hypothetical protein